MPFGLDTRTAVIVALFVLFGLPLIMRALAGRKKTA